MLSLLFQFLFIHFSACDEHTNIYKDGEQVVLWMNTIGPYRNRQETYPFYSLPFCRGPETTIEHAHETLGEALQGTELQYSGISIRYKVDVQSAPVCSITVTQKVRDRLRDAIVDQYWYQMYLDDLPIWSVVGEVANAGNKAYIWTHKKLEIGYNGQRIVRVTLFNSELVPLEVDSQVHFSYSVFWIPSNITFEHRYDEYLDFQFFQHKIHWFSIFNSFMMVLFLVALVFMILLRTLRRDYARYNKEDGLSDLVGFLLFRLTIVGVTIVQDRELGDEYGWKQVHADVFRQPAYPGLLSSLVGTGAHVALVSIIVLLLAFSNQLYMERGGFVTTAIFVFAATSPFSGLVGGGMYARLSGKRWIRQFLLGATLVPLLICSAAFLVNLVAAYYQTSRTIPVLTMFMVVAIVLFVVIPLNLVGTVIGRNLCGQANDPCRISAVPRPIPEKKWFMEPSVLILVSGILPFGSIFIELYFIFTSFWAYKIYFVFGFTLLVLLLLMTVTSSVSAVGTYFLLNSEDYRW
ncbi:Transmembrane 9 superfamily member [Fasciola gigantica]|uniref:Transmembrane 9 superfamily member n=1 Tax=Fasciola gigantica TaxID=46835 RepID=A0A504Y9Y9_FASGI|nr:Transmembrane 9 superfamily member [Fasciola gigantica]